MMNWVTYLNLRGFSKHRNLTELQMQEKNRRSKNERGFLCRFFVSFTCETSFFFVCKLISVPIEYS